MDSENITESQTSLVHINNKYISSFEEISDMYNYFIFDCDGIIWKESEIFENCKIAIKKLIANNKTVIFLSNTNKFSRNDLKNKFATKCGLDININNIYTASYLISKYISDFYSQVKNVFLIGSSGLQNELEEKGIKIFGGPENKNINFINNFSASQIHNLEVEEEIQACVCGYDELFNYYKLVYAGEVVDKTGLLFGTNYDVKTRVGKKYSPGTYCFISTLETYTGQKAQIVTKPDPRSFDIITKDHDIDYQSNKTKILMIGDNPNTDILYARNNNIDSLLVLTGVTTEKDLSTLDDSLSPTYILKSF